MVLSWTYWPSLWKLLLVRCSFFFYFLKVCLMEIYFLPLNGSLFCFFMFPVILCWYLPIWENNYLSQSFLTGFIKARPSPVSPPRNSGDLSNLFLGCSTSDLCVNDKGFNLLLSLFLSAITRSWKQWHTSSFQESRVCWVP